MDPPQNSFNMTLDQVISLKKKQLASGNPDLENFSLDDIIQMAKTQKVGTTSTESQTVRGDPLCMSLKEVILERNIPTPSRGSGQAKFEPQPKLCSGTLDETISAEKPRQYGKPVEKITLRSLDPLTSALDDMIEVALEGESGSSVKALKRKQEQFDDNNESSGEQPEILTKTPWRVLQVLARQKMMIEHITGRLHEDTGDRSHLWRCHVTCGDVAGVADSARKAVAREMASLDFLTQLKQKHEGIQVPEYEVPEEVFIDPKIFHRLIDRANEKAMFVSNEVKVKPIPRDDPLNHRYYFFYTNVCTYFVGKHTFEAEHVDVNFAKLSAAKKALEFVTGQEVSKTRYFTGEDCDPNVKYDYGDSGSWDFGEDSQNAVQSAEAVSSQEMDTRNSKRQKKAE